MSTAIQRRGRPGLATLIEKFPLILLLALLVWLSVQSPYFLSWQNISLMLVQSVPLAILCFGLVCVIAVGGDDVVSGGIDLSLPATAVLGVALLSLGLAEWHTPYLLLLALLAVLGVSLSFFGKLCVELAGYGGRAAEPTQAFFVWIAAILLLSLGVSVWGIALSIYNGVTFNRRYFEQQHGDPAVPAHTGAVVGGAAAWVGVYIIAVVALVAALLPAAMQDAQQHQAPGTLPYAQSVPQALPDDNATYGTEHYGAAVSDALEAHWGEGSDQALLNGYIPAQAAGGTLEERLRGSHLFYSDARTLDELFAAAEDVQWYTDYEPDADGTEYADASWIMGDTVLVCVFAVSDTYTWVVDFYSYLNGEDPTADGCYTFWDEERSALLLELYGENASEEPSLARQMRGAWVDGAGGAVLLDESFFDGTDYTLGTMMDGGVQCWVQDDGSYIVFVLDETGNALTARWYDGSGTLRAEQSFTRGTPG